MFSNEIMPKLCSKYFCKKCDYNTSKKSSYDNHILSRKHQKSMIVNQNMPKLCSDYICPNCNKIYKDNSGLWRHKQKGACKIIDDDYKPSDNKFINDDISPELIKLITELVKGQNGLQESIIELCKNGTTNNSHNTTTNSHNKAFNLQFFLNETCKDAMNIMDFVESIQLQLSDLEKVGEIGYVEGISNIIVKNLKELDVTQRPVHCTDKKRETIYIKDENKWEKDDDKNKIRKMIKRIASKNQRLLLKFKELHPDCIKYHSKYSDQYNKLIVESMGGSGNNDLEKEDKIIRNIVKNVVVDKDPGSL